MDTCYTHDRLKISTSLTEGESKVRFRKDLATQLNLSDVAYLSKLEIGRLLSEIGVYFGKDLATQVDLSDVACLSKLEIRRLLSEIKVKSL
jgi:hypothetical protein